MKIFLIILNIIFINLKLSAEENLNYDTEITTDSGITLYQNEKYYELIDNVKIKSQNFNLKAENVIAYYKDDLYDLVKIIAKKNAEIDTLDGAIITGDEIIYEIESGNFFISGNGFFSNEKLTVKSDEIKGEIKEFNKEKYINIVEAKDNKKVYIENQNMKSYSKSAIYSKDNNLLELFDELKIIKGQEITTGDYASINMETNNYSIKSINNKVQLLISSED